VTFKLHPKWLCRNILLEPNGKSQLQDKQILTKNNLHEAIGISHLKDDPAPLNATNGEDEKSEVVEEGVRLSTLVHPQSVIHVKSPLLLLDQLVFGRNVLPERVLANVAAQVLSSCSSC